MPLTNEQQELLGAWLDGELRGPELAAAERLLREPAAAAYVAGLRRLRELLDACPPVRCPVGLKSRVMAALDSGFDGISRPTNELAPVRRLRWTTPAAAAAAALFLGLWVFSMVGGPATPGQPASVARGTGAPAGTAQPVDDALPPRTMPAAMEATTDHNEDDRSQDAGKGDRRNDGGTGGGGGVNAAGGTGNPGQPGGMAAARPRSGAGARKHTEHAGGTLNLDRGHDEPLELVLHVDRERPAGLMHAYNDLLLVSCLYGNARLLEAPASVAIPALESADYDDLGSAEDGVTHNDFTLFDGVEAEVPEGDLPALLAALRRLATEQNYGEMQVPEDLDMLVSATGATVDELNELAGDDKGDNDAQASSLRAYLPPQAQNQHLQREAAREGEQGVNERLLRLKELEARQPRDLIAAKTRQARGGKGLRVIIRLK